MADNLLDKASILLTPTAYNDGSMLSVKPNENLYGSELVTNGDFATDSDWTKDSNWSIVNGVATSTGGGRMFQSIPFLETNIGTNVKVSFDITERISGGVKIDCYGAASQVFTDVGTHTFIGKTTNSLNLYINNSGQGNLVGSIDNVSVVEDLTGDFQFSRGSAATRVNAQGLVENVQIISDELVSNGNFSQEGSELITNGDFATDSDWITNDWSISGGTLNGSASTGIVFQNNIGTVVGKTYKVVLEISNYASGTIRFKVGGDSYQNIASEDGVQEFYFVAATTANNILFSVQSAYTGSIDNISVKEVGQDWTLGTGWSIGDGKATADGTINSNCYQDAVTTIGQTYKYSFDVLDSGSGVIDGRFRNGGGVIQGFSSEGTYTGTFVAYNTLADFTTLSGNTASFSITNISVKEITDDTDLPRIDYTDGCGSWLLEPQSTNLITYSEDFSSLNSRDNAVVTSNEVISPSGDLNADKITFDGTLYGRVEQTITATIGQPYTISLYLKNKDLSDVTQVWIGFSQIGQGQFVTITDEWQRYEVTINADGTSEYPRIQFSGTGSLYAWGFQTEQQSYATSYIPTNGSIATRLADVANNSGNSTLINSTEGVLYAEIAALADDGTNRSIGLSDGTTDNRVNILFGSSSNRIRAIIKSNGSTSFDEEYNVTSTLDYHKVEIKYKANDFALWIDGVEVATDTSGATPIGLDRVTFDAGNGTLNFYGKCKALAVYKEALTDAQLQSLTTI